MNKLLPDEIKVVVQDATLADIWLYVCPQLFWFDGHFPTQPVLPGVAQLNWVIHYSKILFNIQQKMTSIDVIKFQLPVLPADELHLKLNWNSETRKLGFTYAVANKVASTGKLKL